MIEIFTSSLAHRTKNISCPQQTARHRTKVDCRGQARHAGEGFDHETGERVDEFTDQKKFLKGSAAAAGAAVGSGAIGGFPTIWAQEIKDIELRHLDVSYSVVKAIGDQAAKDLGFKVTMQNLDTSAAINRFITQPTLMRLMNVPEPDPMRPAVIKQDSFQIWLAGRFV